MSVKWCAVSVVCWLSLVSVGHGKIRVTTDFPGGSGHVIAIDQSKLAIRLTPAKQPNGGWRTWWYVKVDGLSADQPFSLEVGPTPWATPKRAFMSRDRKVWRHTPAGQSGASKMRYTITPRSQSLFLAWGPPFLAQDGKNLIDEVCKSNKQARRVVVAVSRNKRPVNALEIRAPEHKLGVWVQARQHAWETGSSWVCEGLVRWVTSASPQAQRFRKHVSVFIVPIVDVDSVEAGLGGKGQSPRDHNRDWQTKPHWPYVAAAMKRLKRMSQNGKLDVFIDLHNPGATVRRPFFLVPPRKYLSVTSKRYLDDFLAACEVELNNAPLSFRGANFESGANYDARWRSIAKNWVTLNLRSELVSVTLETPWNTVNSTVKGYRAVGRGLGRSLLRYADRTAQ